MLFAEFPFRALNGKKPSFASPVKKKTARTRECIFGENRRREKEQRMYTYRARGKKRDEKRGRERPREAERDNSIYIENCIVHDRIML